MVVLQEVGKTLVHSGDVMMNICFFKVGKGLLYSSHGFLSGRCSSSGKVLGMGLTAQVLEGWRFSSVLRVQTDPGVHSASYKMSTGVKAAEHKTSHPTSF